MVTRGILLQKFLLLPAFISVDSLSVVFQHISSLLWSEWLLLQIPSKIELKQDENNCVFSSLVFKACCKIKHSNWWKLKISFLWSSLSGRKTKYKQEFRTGQLATRNNLSARSTRSNHPSPTLLSFWTATGLVSPATSLPNSLQEGQIWLAATSLCWGPEQWGWLSCRPWGVPCSPAHIQCPHTASCFLSPKPGLDILSWGRELGRGQPCHLRNSPWVCSGADGASILIYLTAYKTKPRIWTEINSRENSQLAPSEAACDINAAGTHRSRSRHFP